MVIKDQNAQLAPGSDHLPEDDRKSAGFADAGGSQNRKVLGNEVFDIHIGRNTGVVVQTADLGKCRFVASENQPQLFTADDAGPVADGGVGANTSSKALLARFVPGDFTHQVDTGDGPRIGAGARLLSFQ